eukprot:scaffold112677_cov42-Prasinocladus_malaysianus.AAC.1
MMLQHMARLLPVCDKMLCLKATADCRVTWKFVFENASAAFHVRLNKIGLVGLWFHYVRARRLGPDNNSQTDDVTWSGASTRRMQANQAHLRSIVLRGACCLCRWLAACDFSCGGSAAVDSVVNPASSSDTPGAVDSLWQLLATRRPTLLISVLLPIKAGLSSGLRTRQGEAGRSFRLGGLPISPWFLWVPPLIEAVAAGGLTISCRSENTSFDTLQCAGSADTVSSRTFSVSRAEASLSALLLLAWTTVAADKRAFPRLMFVTAFLVPDRVLRTPDACLLTNGFALLELAWLLMSSCDVKAEGSPLFGLCLSHVRQDKFWTFRALGQLSLKNK